MGDDARVDAELGQRLAAALGVHDHPVEALEQPPPEVALARRAARQQVVRGEDRGRPEPQVHIGLRQREPLHVHDVGVRRARATP